MTTTARFLISVSLFATVHANAADITLHWSEIAATVQGAKATIVLTSGTKVKATIADVLPAAIRLDNNQSIARDTITQIRIRKNHIRGRVIGTTVGLFFGGLGALEGDVGSPGARAAAAAVWIGGGYLIGYAIDRHEIVINIAPDILKTNSGQ